MSRILLTHTLRWDYQLPTTYRLVAKTVEPNLGFEGFYFIVEKLDGYDAMGGERWVEAQTTEGSRCLAAIGQSLLDQQVKNDTPSTP